MVAELLHGSGWRAAEIAHKADGLHVTAMENTSIAGGPRQREFWVPEFVSKANKPRIPTAFRWF